MVAEHGRRRRPVERVLVSGVVLVISKHTRVAGTVDGACGEQHRVDAETRDGGSSQYSDATFTARLDAVDDQHEVAQAASSA